MSEELIKKYNLEEGDFWILRGKKIISFGGVVKMIDTEGISLKCLIILSIEKEWELQ